MAKWISNNTSLAIIFKCLECTNASLIITCLSTFTQTMEEVQKNFSLLTQVSLPTSKENSNTEENALNLQIIPISAH